MTSIGSSAKQIPLNNGYFRAFTGMVGNPSSFVYAPSGTLSDGRVSTMVLAQVAGLTDANLSSGLFKDMGTQAVVNGSTFRRLQLVSTIAATGGVAGASAGVDSDYFNFYILTGFGGAGVPSPFVRTG
jgi:hypothetical protein